MESPTIPRSNHGPASPAPQPPPAPPHVNWVLWIAAVIVLAIIGVIFGIIPRMKHKTDLEKDTRELAIPTVAVVMAKPGAASTGMLLPAEVRAFVEAPIYARANGYVTNWQVDIGAQVKTGQLLAVIDTPEIDEELEAAKAAQVQAESALALARITATRWAQLLKTASVSEQENAEKAADLQVKQANLDAAKATVQRYADLKAFNQVTAPFSGTITGRNIDVGDLITPGKEMFRLADTHTLRVFVRVPQSGTPGLTIGDKADILISEMPGKIFKATIVRTAGAIEANSRTLLLELDLDNAKGQIIAGSYAQVAFHESNVTPQLEIPANTLLFRAEGPQVGKVTADGTVQLVSILVGRDLGPNVEVLSGITAQDPIILNPSDSLISGQKVRVASATDAKPAAK